MNILYKYRSLDAFRFFIDILKNKNLYAAKFTELRVCSFFAHAESFNERNWTSIDEAKGTSYNRQKQSVFPVLYRLYKHC